jgi:hypothetical protein
MIESGKVDHRYMFSISQVIMMSWMILKAPFDERIGRCSKTLKSERAKAAKGPEFVEHAGSFVELGKLARFLVSIKGGVSESRDVFVKKMKSLPIFMHGFMAIRGQKNKQYFPLEVKIPPALPAALPVAEEPRSPGMFQFV